MNEKTVVLIPRTLWTKYRTDGQQWVCIWRQWLWWTWSPVHFRVEEAL